MSRTVLFAVFAAAITVSCSRLSPEQQLLHDVADAMGGSERIAAVRTLLLEGGGTHYNLGQDVVPGATGQTYTVSNYRFAADLGNARAKRELTRTPNFAYFMGLAPQPQVQGLDGEVAYNVAANGTAQRIGDAAARDRRAEWRLHPLLAARAALAPDTKLANRRDEAGLTQLDVTTADGEQFTIAIDSASKLPATVAARVYDSMLGDVMLKTSFDEYQEVGGLKLPATLSTEIDGFTTARIELQRQTLDGELGDIAAPVAAASAPASPGAAPTVSAEPLADGITLLAGGSHHSVLVEYADHLLLIEAPQNSARTQAVIAKARELVPGKPLTQLVNSHHHFDHSGGVRAAMAEGMSLITHQGNVAFFEGLAKRAHTLQPDALAQSGKAASVLGVTDQLVIADDSLSMILYTVSGVHSETMLMAYFPRQRLLVEADVYSSGRPLQMFAKEFLVKLQERKLRIDRIVPLHGTVVSYAQFLKDTAAQQDTAPTASR